VRASQTIMARAAAIALAVAGASLSVVCVAADYAYVPVDDAMRATANAIQVRRVQGRGGGGGEAERGGCAPVGGAQTAAFAAANTTWQRLAYATDTFGPRLSGSAALEATLDWIAATAAAEGLNVIQEPVQVCNTRGRGCEGAGMGGLRARRGHHPLCNRCPCGCAATSGAA
jgi:hypothetical protein